MTNPSWEDTQPVSDGAPAAAGETPTWDNTADASEKYGGTLGGLKAFGLGAARSATFGISDQLLTKLGAVSPEDLRQYKEQNPIATGAGEVGGVLGAVIAPEEGILGALSAPVKAVSKVGGAVSEAVAPVAEGVAGKLAGAETSPILNKILSQAGASAAGSAVEGAAYGLGQSVSEQALGDPDLNAEKVMANVGLGALTGGALGSIFGAVKGGVQAKFPNFLSEVDKSAIDSGDFEAMANHSEMPDSQKEGFIAGLTKIRDDAPEVRQAAAELDNAPVLPGMVSASKDVQTGQSVLLEGDPTFAGMKARAVAQEGLTKASSAVDNTLSSDNDFTKATLGEHLQDMVSSHVAEQAKPINELYAELKSRYETIPVSENATRQIARNIRNLEDVPLSRQAQSIAEDVASRVENLKTVDDVKRLKTIINDELPQLPSKLQKRMTAVIADKLSDLEENSVTRFAEQKMKTDVAKGKIMDLLEQRKAANAQYSVFRDKLQRLGEVLGRKRIHGAQDFIDFIENDITPEKVADKITGKNNAQFLDWFSKEFPEGMQAVRKYQKGLIREASMTNGDFDVRKAIKAIGKFPKEYQEKIFSPDEMRKIAAAKTYMDRFPQRFNTSNTDNAAAFRRFFTSPISAATSNVRDLAIDKFINSATSEGKDEVGSFIDGLVNIERTAAKTSKDVKSGVNAIFSGGAAGSPVKGYLAISADDRRDNHDKLEPHLNEMSQNPEKLIDKIQEKTDAISRFAPNTAAGLQGTMSRAVQFLQSKLPAANTPQAPLSSKYKPSDAELSKWHNYFSAVESPINILHSVANGSLTPAQVEAVSVVYPKLMNEMRASVTDKMTENMAKKAVIPYKTRLSLSIFMGSDLVNSLNPQNILATQNTLATATQAKVANEKMSGINKNGLGKISKSDRLLTPMQQSLQREEA